MKSFQPSGGLRWICRNILPICPFVMQLFQILRQVNSQKLRVPGNDQYITLIKRHAYLDSPRYVITIYPGIDTDCQQVIS